MVMGDNSCSRRCGFKSQHHILNKHDIFHIDLLLNCIVCLKTTENKIKRGRGWPIKYLFSS